MHKLIVFAFLCCSIILPSCKERTLLEVNPTEQSTDEEKLAGKLTVNDISENAFGNQVPYLSSEQSDIFVLGNSLFRQNWVTAPASTMARDGLGAFFNARSCGSCHGKDGRGQPPEPGSVEMNSLLFRIGVDGKGIHGEPLPHPEFGGQIQSSAIMGVEPEAIPIVEYFDFEFVYSDGEKVLLRNPSYSFSYNYGSVIGNIKISPRVGLQLCGMGLLESISENDILQNADPNDLNGDGISGKANYVWNIKKGIKQIGRFGWKANQPTLMQQVAGAFNGDIGITSSMFPKEDYPKSFSDKFINIPNGGEPELSDKALEQVTFYCQTLSVPARRNVRNKDVIEGKNLFVKANCNNCHKESFTTSSSANPSVLSTIKIKPYTDMLLHDMGDALADGREDFEAIGNEWRTTPLWGIGLIKTVNKHTFLLHDGRARNIEEAILWHGGEAKKSKEIFTSYDKSKRKQILAFLESL